MVLLASVITEPSRYRAGNLISRSSRKKHFATHDYNVWLSELISWCFVLHSPPLPCESVVELITLYCWHMLPALKVLWAERVVILCVECVAHGCDGPHTMRGKMRRGEKIDWWAEVWRGQVSSIQISCSWLENASTEPANNTRLAKTRPWHQWHSFLLKHSDLGHYCYHCTQWNLFQLST